MNTKSEEREKFSRHIESLADKLKVNTIEAIVHYCEENEVEIESAAALINDRLKEKLHLEAQKLRILPRDSRLPL